MEGKTNRVFISFEMDSIDVHTDIPYDTPHRCKLDLMTGMTSGAPVILFIHGGAWMLGDKITTRSVCTQMAQWGYVVASCNYQLSPIPRGAIRQFIIWYGGLGLLLMLSMDFEEYWVVLFAVGMFCLLVVFHTWCLIKTRDQTTSNMASAEHIRDVNQAMTWLKGNVHRYGGDSSKIIVMGHSAGAHLAALLAQTWDVKAAVCISGVYSFRRLREVPLGTYLVQCAFGHSEDYLTHFPCDRLGAETLETLPPHLLLNARYDLTLIRHTWDFHTRLRTLHVPVSSLSFPGTHFSIMRDWSTSNEPVACRIRHFLAWALYRNSSNPIPIHLPSTSIAEWLTALQRPDPIGTVYPLHPPPDPDPGNRPQADGVPPQVHDPWTPPRDKCISVLHPISGPLPQEH